ncbi:MAG: hypothetical protein ACR2OG_12345 [Gemmatimonadaceae bacterium]
MKAIRIAVVGAAVGLAGASCARPQSPPPEQPVAATAQGDVAERGGDARGRDRGGMMLFNGITLTDAQKAQIDSVRARYRAQMPARTPGTPPDEATREKRRGLMKAQSDEIRALLTDDQKKIYDANLAEMQSRMQQRPPTS